MTSVRLSQEPIIDLEKRLDEALVERCAVTKSVRRDGRSKFDEVETAEFRKLAATIEALRENIAEAKDEAAHKNALDNAALSGETRVVISGSVDVPIQVPLSPTQFRLPFPQRLIGILRNRIEIESTA